jgi:hypothetical protein
MTRGSLSARALLEEKIRLNSVSNEGKFSLYDETVFRSYFLWHCSGVTEICHVKLHAHALRSVQVRLKSVCI